MLFIYSAAEMQELSKSKVLKKIQKKQCGGNKGCKCDALMATVRLSAAR